MKHFRIKTKIEQEGCDVRYKNSIVEAHRTFKVGTFRKVETIVEVELLERPEDIEKERNIQASVFFVKATNEEVHMLWKEHHESKLWNEKSMGFSQILGGIDGDIKNKPVNVSFSFSNINGHTVCFYETVSRFNDTELVDKWIRENYPVKWDNGSRDAITNASNFHHAIQHIEKLNHG